MLSVPSTSTLLRGSKSTPFPREIKKEKEIHALISTMDTDDELVSSLAELLLRP
jgi:hypothetical protein